MSGSEESSQIQIPPARSYLGLGLRLQIISGLLIIADSLTLSNVFPLIGTVWGLTLGFLFVIGILQMVILRSLIQKETYSVPVAAAAALTAMQLAILNWSQLLTVIGAGWRLFPLIVILITNAVIFICFLKVHLEGGIKSAFLPKD